LVFVEVAGGQLGSGASGLNVIRPLVVDVAYDHEAHVWIGICEEAAGFACEAKTLPLVPGKCRAIIGDLVDMRELHREFGLRKIRLNRLALKVLLLKNDL
jgi:Domain of unknown function (DUF1902)